MSMANWRLLIGGFIGFMIGFGADLWIPEEHQRLVKNVFWGILLIWISVLGLYHYGYIDLDEEKE